MGTSRQLSLMRVTLTSQHALSTTANYNSHPELTGGNVAPSMASQLPTFHPRFWVSSSHAALAEPLLHPARPPGGRGETVRCRNLCLEIRWAEAVLCVSCFFPLKAFVLFSFFFSLFWIFLLQPQGISQGLHFEVSRLQSLLGSQWQLCLKGNATHTNPTWKERNEGCVRLFAASVL